MRGAMDNLDMLSDTELRHRLMQFGFPNMPVTDTTRKTLIKKLRNHMNNEKSKIRRETNYAARYSSDEESSDRDTNQQQQRSRATTRTASPTLTTTTTFRQSSYNNNNNNNNSYLNRSSKIMPPPANPTARRYMSGGSATVPPTTSYVGVNRTSPVIASTALDKTPSPIRSIYISPPMFANETDEDSDYYASPKPKSPTQPITSAATSRSNLSYPNNSPYMTPDRSGNESWIRNRYTVPALDTSFSSPPKTNGHHYPSAPNNVDDSPYMSEFTRRLLKLRGKTIRDSIYRGTSGVPPPPRFSSLTAAPPNRVIRTNDMVHQQTEQQTSDWNISPSTAFSNLINRLEEQYGFKQTLIPCVLLTILIGFFAIVAFMYLTISPDLASTINEKNTYFNACPSSSQQNDFAATSIATSSSGCLNNKSVKDAIELLKLMAPELQKRIEQNKCHDNTVSYFLNPKDIIQFAMERDGSKNVRKLQKDLSNLEYLIEKNPQWNIKYMDNDEKLIGFERLVQIRDTQDYNFAIAEPKLPFTCTLYNKLHQFFFIIGFFGIGLVGIFLIYYLICGFRKYQQSRRDEVSALLEEIINALMQKAASDPDQCAVVVNHLRDKIIPIQNRRKLDWSWNAAIKYLEQNESRIQFELGIRNGEDCKLMRWIDTVKPDHAGTGPVSQKSHVKKWQSPAFDKSNKIACPPTECLKIRQMFDKYEANNSHLKTIIQDSILEKVGPKCKIYDIQLDKSSCCVYVRCATKEDAGHVHDEINGWWFDMRLVSIKFLRLERYLNRFPKASCGPACLRPSNTKNLSMTQCHRDGAGVNGLPDDDDDDDVEIGDD